MSFGAFIRWGAVMSGILMTAFALGLVFYLLTQDEYSGESGGFDEIIWEANNQKKPPQPIYNEDDDSECIEVIEKYYEWAVDSYEGR